MKTESYQLFAHMLERIAYDSFPNTLTEASSTGSLIGSLPGGPEMIRYLHSSQGLGHDQEWRETGMSWSEFKTHSRGAWVLLKYRHGVGAIKQQNGTYTAIASRPGQAIETFANERGGKIFTFLKDQLNDGSPAAENQSGATKLYVGVDTGATRTKQKGRQELKKELNKVNVMTYEDLVKKFKPLWVKAITTSIADIKQVLTAQIKNDAFNKASSKLQILTNLSNALDELENRPNALPDVIKAAVSKALELTAAHYYPEEYGEYEANSRNRYSRSSDSGLGEKILKDISEGDQSKLGAVLAYFKQALLHPSSRY